MEVPFIVLNALVLMLEWLLDVVNQHALIVDIASVAK